MVAFLEMFWLAKVSDMRNAAEKVQKVVVKSVSSKK